MTTGPLHLTVQSIPRDPASLVDDLLVQRLAGLVRDAFERRGQAPSVGVLVRPERIDLLPLGPVARAGVPLVRFMAGLTRAEVDGGDAVEAVGLMGTFSRIHRASGRREPPVAMVFLEWADCRWWQWRALVGGEGLVAETDTTTAAVDGDSKPPALGGWWSLGRRSNLRTRLTRRTPQVEEHSQVH